MKFNLQFDLRNPPFAQVPFQRYYAQFLDMVAWADGAGFDRVAFNEHHFVEDGYCPAPLTVAAAVAARTRQIRIATSIMILTLRHPVQVAEETALIDVISNGRLDLVVAGGYRRNEFDGYGISRSERPGRMEEGIQILKKCWEEDGFDFEGRYWKLRNVRVRPKPVQKPRPRLVLGGSSVAAARRAARLADGFYPGGGAARPAWVDAYREECARLGKEPSPESSRESFNMPRFIHVTRDPDGDWARIAPHALWVTNEYGSYIEDNSPGAFAFKPTTDADSLRRDGHYAMLTPEQAVDLARRVERELGESALLRFQPLMGGMPAELGMKCIELVASEVMPALRRP